MPTPTFQIYDTIASEASQLAALQGLTPNPDSAVQFRNDVQTGSSMAPHRMLMWIVAYAMKLQQSLWERFRKETEELAMDGHYGTRRWFVAKALRFQIGHALVLTEKDAVYAANDPAARIVAKAAVVEQANQVIVKVAKTFGAAIIPLTPEELLAVNDYFQEMRPPVQVMVMTAPADRVRVIGTVVYDGQLGLAAVQVAVHAEMRLYLRTLDFGGVIRVTDLRAAMLRATGVVDVRLDAVEVRTTGSWTVIPRVHYTYAGYATVDSATPIQNTMAWQVGNI